MSAAPIEKDDAEILLLVGELRRARGLRVAARRALRLARRYREEEGPRGERETACVRQALVWRASAARLRSGHEAGPGLRRASVPPSGEAARQASG